MYLSAVLQNWVLRVESNYFDLWSFWSSWNFLACTRQRQLWSYAMQQNGHGPSACARQAKAGSMPGWLAVTGVRARASLSLRAAEEVTSMLWSIKIPLLFPPYTLLCSQDHKDVRECVFFKALQMFMGFWLWILNYCNSFKINVPFKICVWFSLSDLPLMQCPLGPLFLLDSENASWY